LGIRASMNGDEHTAVSRHDKVDAAQDRSLRQSAAGAAAATWPLAADAHIMLSSTAAKGVRP